MHDNTGPLQRAGASAYVTENEFVDCMQPLRNLSTFPCQLCLTLKWCVGIPQSVLSSFSTDLSELDVNLHLN